MDNIIFDLYLSGRDGDVPTSVDVDKIEKLFIPSLELNKTDKNLKETDFGKGASWPVVFIEWLNNDYLSATLNLVSLIMIGKSIFNLIKSEHKDHNLFFLGPKSASYLGFYYLDKNFPDKEFKVLSLMELERGSFEFKKEFIVIFEQKNDLPNDNLQILSNVDSSILGKLIILHLDWNGDLKSIDTC